jgi:hypothetical protein
MVKGISETAPELILPMPIERLPTREKPVIH